MSDHVITIYDEGGERTRTTFPAPADKYVARSLWVFLVDNLQPGFVVQLSLGDDLAELTRQSDHKVTPELYRELMDV